MWITQTNQIPLAMPQSKSIPIPVLIVACIFIFSGLNACFKVLSLLSQGHYNINFNVLSIFIGIGLIRLNPTWRIVALAYSAFYIFVGAFSALILLLRLPKPASLNVSQASPEIAFILSIALLAIGCWQIYVLSTGEIKTSFGISG